MRMPALLIHPKLFKFVIIAAIALAPSAPVVLGDMLELKTGQVVQGKFIAATTTNIRFQVDGQEQVFATKDVLNIGFSDSGDTSSAASSAPPPEPAAPPEAPAAQPTTAESAAVPPAPDAPNAPPAPQAAPTPDSPTPQPEGTTQAITIPAGTTVLVRMIDGVDSSQNKVGDIFHASLEGPLVVGNTVVAPKGVDVYGKLSQVKDAGKISGAPQLTLELTGIRINGNIVPVDSTDYDVAGKGRGAQSAQRIGGGAVLGAVLGGIIGGGRGAAIGATLGAGGGAAVQVMTKGEQVRIPSETLLEFRLQQDVAAPLPASSN
jgi:outer membrane lipoprotein SlyB